jgi:hypothetical protein
MNALRILPEIVLTLSGIIVMLADATMPKAASRKPLGWLAALGTLTALGVSFWQYPSPSPASSSLLSSSPSTPSLRKQKASANSSPSCNSAQSA